MEEILASIRRIIADDQALPLAPRPSSTNLRAVVADAGSGPSVSPGPPRRGLRPTFQPDSVEAEFRSSLAATLSNTRISDTKSVPPLPAQSRLEADEPARKDEASTKDEASAAPADIGSSGPASIMPRVELSAGQSATEAPRDAYDEPSKDEASVVMPVQTAVAAMPPAVSATPRNDALLSPSTDASVASSFNVLATTMFLQNSGVMEQAVQDMLRPMLQRWLDDNLPTMVERLVRTEIERVARGGRS